MKGGITEREKKFYPDYLVEVLFAMLAIAVLTVAAALAFPKEIGRRISFSAAFRPKPEWFFLWFFEILKYFPGNFAVIGAVIIPFTVVIALAAIPFIDAGTRGRTRAAAAIGIIYFAFILFTIIPALDY